MWNPKNHIMDAWDAQTTKSGKTSVVIFYLWLWSNVIWSVWTLVTPWAAESSCSHENMDAFTSDMVAVSLQSMNLFFVAFLLYISMHHVHWCNVTILAVVMVVNTWFWTCAMHRAIEDGHNIITEECWHKQMKIMNWYCTFVPIVVWVLVLVEYFTGDHGSTGENRPLIS